MKLILIFCVSLISVSVFSQKAEIAKTQMVNAEVTEGELNEGELTEQSSQLKLALGKIDTGGIEDFVRWFPKTRSEFDKTCNSPKFDQLYDCYEVFSVGVAKSLLMLPNEIGIKLAVLASEVKFSADAPNYLQSSWNGFCLMNPKAFSYSLSKLNSKKQKQAFKYMTKGIQADNNTALELCAEVLKKSGFRKLSNKALQNKI